MRRVITGRTRTRLKDDAPGGGGYEQNRLSLGLWLFIISVSLLLRYHMLVDLQIKGSEHLGSFQKVHILLPIGDNMC